MGPVTCVTFAQRSVVTAESGLRQLVNHQKRGSRQQRMRSHLAYAVAILLLRLFTITDGSASVNQHDAERKHCLDAFAAKQIAKAVDLCRRGVQLMPNDSDMHRSLALSLVAQGVCLLEMRSHGATLGLSELRHCLRERRRGQR